MRTFLLGAILIATMMNGCVQREQNKRMEESLHQINQLLQRGLRIRLEVPGPRAPASVDQRAERDT